MYNHAYIDMIRRAASDGVFCIVRTPCSSNFFTRPVQDPIDLRQEAEAIYSAFELSLCRDVVFEVGACVHVYLVQAWDEAGDTLSRST